MLLRELCVALVEDGQAPDDCADADALFARIFKGYSLTTYWSEST